jgi:hypothetical protein
VGDPGGAGREFNNVTMALTSIIDQYDDTAGLVLMAATNRLDGLDDALLREGRFDLRLRLDLPDEAERERILARAQTPSSRFDLHELTRLTPGASPAKLSWWALFGKTSDSSAESGTARPTLEDVPQRHPPGGRGSIEDIANTLEGASPSAGHLHCREANGIQSSY